MSKSALGELNRNAHRLSAAKGVHGGALPFILGNQRSVFHALHRRPAPAFQAYR
jgi:hypothetical protein